MSTNVKARHASLGIKLFVCFASVLLFAGVFFSFFVQPPSGRNKGASVLQPEQAALKTKNTRLVQEDQIRLNESNELYKAGVVAQKKDHDAAKAKTFFLKSLSLDPANAFARYELAQVLDQLGEFQEAYKHYKLIVYPPPKSGSTLRNDTHVLWRYAELSKQFGNSEESEKAMDRIAENSRWPALPTEASERKALAMIRYALLFFEGDQVAKSEKLLKQAIKLAPSYAPAYYYLGEMYRRQKNWQNAKTAYEQALRYGDGDPKITQFVPEQIEIAKAHLDHQRKNKNTKK